MKTVKTVETVKTVKTVYTVQGVTTRCSLAAGLRGNGERMRKWTENEEMERE